MNERPLHLGRRLLSAALLAFALLSAGGAGAWCRTTTCDPKGKDGPLCVVDAQGCATNGLPLRWATGCSSFDVQANGSPKHQLTYAQVHDVVSGEFGRWLGSDCGAGQRPGLGMLDRGPVACNTPQYNQDGPNANVWMFQDGTWPHAGQDRTTLALTTVTFNVETGEIYDADVEVNGTNSITVGVAGSPYDLSTIVAHEAGHFLGMGHSSLPTASMYYAYHSTTGLLSADDSGGICAAYPPDTAVACTDAAAMPRRGFTSDCWTAPPKDGGCAMDPARPAAVGALAPGLLFLGGLMVWWRRRGRRA